MLSIFVDINHLKEKTFNNRYFSLRGKKKPMLLNLLTLINFNFKIYHTCQRLLLPTIGNIRNRLKVYKMLH